jgi:dihydrofolate reductase
MGRLMVQMQASIDGFVGSDDPASRWQLWDWGGQWPWTPDLRARFNAALADADGILLSRPMTEEGYLDHWERVALDHADDPDYAFARQIGQLSKIIVTSRQIDLPPPRTAVVTGEFVEAVARAKQSVAGDLMCFGGAGFVAALLGSGLVDELALYINPGLAGSGKRIFDGLPLNARFTLLDATPTDCGVVIARWAPLTSGVAGPRGRRATLPLYGWQPRAWPSGWTRGRSRSCH